MAIFVFLRLLKVGTERDLMKATGMSDVAGLVVLISSPAKDSLRRTAFRPVTPLVVSRIIRTLLAYPVE